jgi:hypothetical protein
MLAGLDKASGNDSEYGARKAALGNTSREDETERWISLPQQRSIFRYNPPVFD